MKYLLDTCILSHFMRGTPAVLERIKSTPPTQLAISSITQMEIEYGLQLNPQRAVKLRPVFNALTQAIHVLPYHSEDANQCAMIRAHLKQQGTPIGPYDVLLAGCAKQRHLIFVTDNFKEFQRIDGLLLENWVR